jgi:hypothetical protein
MPVLNTCPPGKTLHDFILGHLSDEDSSVVEMHLVGCSACLRTVAAIRAEDTLVTAIRQGKETPCPEPEVDVVQSLIDRLQHLPGVAGASGAEIPSTLTPSAGNPSGRPHDFLAPPRGPGEIGWLGPSRPPDVLGGGMGLVFLAEDPRLKRRVALTVMRPTLAASVSAQQRFLREGQATAAIEHDHIIPIYQVGEDRGVPFLAMPLLRGESLDRRVQRQEKLPLAEVLRIGREIASGLAAAHAVGLIHRDIKPSSIWMEGEPGASPTGEEQR